jgi:hypothetical protein
LIRHQGESFALPPVLAVRAGTINMLCSILGFREKIDDCRSSRVIANVARRPLHAGTLSGTLSSIASGSPLAIAPHLYALGIRRETVAMVRILFSGEPCVNIFVGNLAFTTSEADLRQLFASYGTVETVRIMTDRETGRSRGFGFVEMPDNHAAESAIDALNGTPLAGRTLTVNEARPREPRREPRQPRW